MRMPPFNLHNPSTLEDALAMASELESSGEEFDWISGGTDLIPNYKWHLNTCLLYTSPSPRDGLLSRMPSSA